MNLGYLCEVFDISLESAHRALDDTLATLQVFQKLIEKFQNLSQTELSFVWYYFSQSQDVGIRILRDTYLEAPKNPLSPLSFTESYIQSLQKKTLDIEDIYTSNTSINIEEFLANIPGFELRENQKKMLDKVDMTFSK